MTAPVCVSKTAEIFAGDGLHRDMGDANSGSEF